MENLENGLGGSGTYRVLSLDKLISNGIVYEEYQSFKHSIFSDVYARAQKLTEDIILANEECQEQRARSVRLKSSSSFELSNIISFVGRRGTGKTSSMHSFAQVLSEYSGEREYHNTGEISFSRKLQRVSLKFYVLECIDASLLEASEDIFILILANMFGIIQDKTKRDASKLNDYDNRILFEKFEKVYDDFTSLNGNLRENDGYSAFEKLRNLASSQRLRSNFEELVRMYLAARENSDGYSREKREPYLVIMIDDLDMAKQNKGKDSGNSGCFKILDSLYKYLTVPNVIVLTAYNEENLYNHCVDYFREQYREGNSGAGTIASQYIKKVFPIYTRLYMPTWSKRDLENEKKIKIDLRNRDDILQRYQEKRYLSVKEFSMALLAERTGIYFDRGGKKRHFFEPKTLRTLFNITELLMGMESYDHAFPENEDLGKFEHNIERLKEDFYFRFSHDLLTNPDEKVLFQSWQEQRIDRRAETIVQRLSQETIPLSRRLREEHPELVEKAQSGQSKEYVKLLDNSKVPYSYAELIHSLYHMTRDPGNYSRKLVSCVLYSFTIYLTELYHRYQYYKKELSKERLRNLFNTGDKTEWGSGTRENEIVECYEILKGMIGVSICGKWTEYFFPQVMMEADQGLFNLAKQKCYTIGYVSDKDRPRFEVEFDINNRDAFEKNLRRFLFVAMMQTDVLSWTDEDIKCNLSKDSVVFILTERAHTDFDLLAFMKYAFCYAEFLTKMEALMINALKEPEELKRRCAELKVEKSVDPLNNLTESFKSIRKCFYDWDMKYGSMILPIYNLDITYNLIKRIFQECCFENIPSINIGRHGDEKAFFTAYDIMLERFPNHLEKLDEIYYIHETNESFADAFRECPVVTWIKEFRAEADSENPSQRWLVSRYFTRIVQEMFNEDLYLTSLD